MEGERTLLAANAASEVAMPGIGGLYIFGNANVVVDKIEMRFRNRH